MPFLPTHGLQAVGRSYRPTPVDGFGWRDIGMGRCEKVRVKNYLGMNRGGYHRFVYLAQPYRDVAEYMSP